MTALDLDAIEARMEQVRNGGNAIYISALNDLFSRDVPALIVEVKQLREALEASIPVLDFVSRGRGYIGCDIYPDATARRALAMADAALSAEAEPNAEVERADTTEAQL